MNTIPVKINLKIISLFRFENINLKMFRKHSKPGNIENFKSVHFINFSEI